MPFATDTRLLSTRLRPPSHLMRYFARRDVPSDSATSTRSRCLARNEAAPAFRGIERAGKPRMDAAMAIIRRLLWAQVSTARSRL
jgi:hypothetical protein